MRCKTILLALLLCSSATAFAAEQPQANQDAEIKLLRKAISEKNAALDAAIRLLHKHPVTSSGIAQEPSSKGTAIPVCKESIFTIVPDQSLEEAQIKKQVANLQPLKDEVDKLKQSIVRRDAILAKYNAMFPWVKEIDQADQLGHDVMLKGIGKARMATEGDKVIIRLDGSLIAKGDKYMENTAKERYLTGAGETARVYYVLNKQAILQK